MGYTVSEYNGKWGYQQIPPTSKPVRTAYRDDVFVYTTAVQTFILCWQKHSIN